MFIENKMSESTSNTIFSFFTLFCIMTNRCRANLANIYIYIKNVLFFENFIVCSFLKAYKDFESKKF